MIRLSERLNAILDVCETNDGIIADIGCDHGKLICVAVLSGRCEKGVGVDISGFSLRKAVEYAEQCGISDRIDFFEGDGFSVIPYPVDTAIIAGMGGIEITHILSQPHQAKKYVLSPHQDSHVLRRFMAENGFCAEKDFVVEDKNKFYPIIVCKKGTCDYVDEEFYLGKNYPPRPDYEKRNEKRLAYLRNIAKGFASSDNASEEIKEELEALSLWEKSKTL